MLTSSSDPKKFTIRKEEEQTKTQDEAVRFVIRVEGVKERQKAIAEFEAEAKTSQPVHAESTEAYAHADPDPLPDEAVKVVAETSPSKSAQLVLNASLLSQHGEPNLARVLLQEALNLDSRNVHAIEKLFSLVPATSQHLNERLLLAKARQSMAPSSESAVALAKLLYEQNELEAALELYFQAAGEISEENATVFEIYKDIGNIYVRQKDFDGAEEYYHKAFALNPDSDTLLVNLGTLEVQRENWALAQGRFRAALNVNPKNDRAWVGLAITHENLGDLELAFANLINAIDLNPLNRTAVHLLAVWSQKYQRLEEAVNALQTYLSKSDYDEEMSLALIELLCEKKDFRSARLELERVLCWSPERSDLLELEARLEEFQHG